MKNLISYFRLLFFALFLLGAGLPKATLAADRPTKLEGVGVTEHLGDLVKIHDLSFRDEQGKQVSLSSYFERNRPVILTLVYFECPKLCTLVLNGLLESLKKSDWNMGEQFEIVTISINPRDTPLLAQQKKEKYLSIYHRPNAEKGWHFLTGDENQIRSLASQIGFQYRYDESEKQYIHSANIFILTPQGKISRYFYGISFLPKDLRFSLIEASNGKVGNVVDRVLLFCFHFDPSKNSYSFKMWRIVQIVLTLQVLALLGLFLKLWRKE